MVARNSVFTYKGRPERVEQIGRELGIKYVLEGSARKSDNQVRITAQLIDTQVVYLDLRGTGRSDAGLTNKWSLEQWPEEIHSFFRVVR